MKDNREKINQIIQIHLQEIDPDKAMLKIRKIVMNMRQPNNKQNKYSLEDIEKQIVEHSGLNMEMLCKKTRKREIVTFRQMAHFKAVKFTDYNLSEIGEYFGGFDHSTCVNSNHRIQNLLDTDRRFKEQHELFLTT